MKDKIKQFICSSLRLKELDDNANFFANGMANSLFSMQLIMFLESEYDLTVSNEDMNITNFCTLNKIVEYINKRR